MIYCFWILSLLFYFYCILYIRHLHLIFLLYCYGLFFSCLCCFSSIIYSCAQLVDQQFRPPQNRAAFSNTLFLNGFYITKKYHINVYYTYLKLFVYIGYIDIKIEY